MAELARGVDPLEVDLLEGLARRVREHALAEGDDALLDAGDAALEQEEVVLDDAVADEAAHAVGGGGVVSERGVLEDAFL